MPKSRQRTLNSKQQKLISWRGVSNWPVLQLGLSLYFCDRQTMTTAAFSTASAIASNTEPAARHITGHVVSSAYPRHHTEARRIPSWTIEFLRKIPKSIVLPVTKTNLLYRYKTCWLCNVGFSYTKFPPEFIWTQWGFFWTQHSSRAPWKK